MSYFQSKRDPKAIKTVFDFNRLLSNGPYAWPGGYPLYFVATDGEAICFKCATDNAGLIRDAVIGKDFASAWNLVYMDINWEDTSCFCSHCNGKIPSAYGDGDGDNVNV